MKMVELKNGSIEPRPYVTSVMLLLRRLYRAEPDLFYLVVKKYRKPEYQLLLETQSVLVASGLLDIHGELDSCVKNVIQSAVTGDFPDIIFGGPLKDDSSSMNKFFRKEED